MKKVKLKTNWLNNTAGDVCWLQDRDAKQLVAGGFAEFLSKDEEKESRSQGSSQKQPAKGQAER